MKLKKEWFGLALAGCVWSATAQTLPVVAAPDAADFLGQTYMMPADPISVPVPASAVAPIPAQTDILNEIFGPNALKLNVNQPVATPVQSRQITPIPGMYYPKQAILTKLPDLPPPVMTYEQSVDTTREPAVRQPDYADQFLESLETGKTVYFTVPREMRVTFYPGKSALSAQALKWVKAFAIKVKNDPRLVMEIRASEENWPLQSKRVGLMLQVILEQGVSRHQVMIYKSPRPKDTVLLGYAPLADKELKKDKKKQKTISW